MDFQFQPGSSSMLTRNVDDGMEDKGNVEETSMYGGRGVGGKLRSSRRNSIKKATPYDRPASGRHSTTGGLPASSVVTHSSSSLASRLVNSASRLITSSASYFFPSLFGHKTLSLTNGNPAPVQGTAIEEEDGKEDLDSTIILETENGLHQSKDCTNSEQQLTVVTVGAGSEKKELDLAQVEDILKQKTWSREQVRRLTDLLNTRLVEHPSSISRFNEAGVQAADTAVHAVEVTPRSTQENTSTPISEAQRWREELKRARTDCAPIEVAKAFMGERTTSQSGLSRSFRGTPHQLDRVAELQPPPGLGLKEDRYRSSPVLRSWNHSPATQVPKRSPLLEEDWMSVGPVRRTRQKTFQMNSSPYARGLAPGDHVLPQALVSPPVQSSQTARKILDTLEIMSPSPKARLLHDDRMGTTEAPMLLTPDIFNFQGRRNLHRAEVSRFSGLRDTSPSNGKLEFGSTSYHPTLTKGAMKESNLKDKSLVNRLLSNNEAPLPNAPSGVLPKGIFSTTSLLYSPVANSLLADSNANVLSPSVSPTSAATSLSFQSEWKPPFSFSIPSSTAGSHHNGDNITVSSPAMVPALSTFTTAPAIPVMAMTWATCASSTSLASTSIFSPPKEQHSGERGAVIEDQFEGPDGTVEELSKVSNNEKGLTSFHFGSSLPPFSFKMGTDDIAAGGQSKSLFLTPFPSSKTTRGLSSSMPHSSPPITAAVSTASVLFGSQSGTSPLFKPSTTGQSIMKLSPVHSLMVEPSSAAFTFSPMPASISCSTSSYEQFSASCSIEIGCEALPSSPAKVPSTDPVFSFTSPSGGIKLPSVAPEDTSLPGPKFTFGRGASPPSGELSAGSLPVVASFQSGVAPALVPSSFTFGGQTASSQLSGLGAGSALLFGSGAGSASLPSSSPFSGQTANAQQFATVAKSTSSPFSAVESLPTPASLEPPVSFTSGATGLEKAGRKFLKAKRRK